MSNFVKDIVTSNTFLTVISGVLVFIAGQLFNEYFLRPIQDYKKLRAKISYSLTYYADLYMDPIKYQDDKDKRRANGSVKLRELSAEVRAIIELKPFGNIFIPKKKTLSDVAENLMGLSNGFFSHQDNIDYVEYNKKRRIETYKLLKIKDY